MMFRSVLPVMFALLNSSLHPVEWLGKAGTAQDGIDPGKLAREITRDDSTDRQRVTSIFRWVTSNIAYNTRSFRNGRYTGSSDLWLESPIEEDTSMILKPLNLRVAEIVLKRRTAVCDGYARLFKTLCDSAGVRCEIITGFGRNNIGRFSTNFRSNHKWNAVYIDTGWHLLDATWAAGYINYRDEFEWQYNPKYFLTPPAEFIEDHYPEDLRWTLLEKPPVMREYYNTPFKTAGFNRNYISSFRPQNGILTAKPGDSIIFEIETVQSKRTLWISDYSYTDTNTIFMLQCCGAVRPANTIQGKKVAITYHVPGEDREWIYLVYDDEVIMRYKLNILLDSLPAPAVAPVNQ